MSYYHSIRRNIITLCIVVCCAKSYAMNVPIYHFSLTPYSQNISDYLPPSDSDYTTPLLTADYQKNQLKQFYTHYYSSDKKALSPWSKSLVNSVLPEVQNTEEKILIDFSNQNKPIKARHYGENFKEHDETWLEKIKLNIPLDALNSVVFNPNSRAIAVNNTLARALPDIAPDFFHAALPGEGFPFDNLQESAIWAGTPLYVISTSNDKAWSLVLTPDAYFAWVKSSDIAYASDTFIHQWQSAAQKGMIAITKTEVSIVDSQQHFQFTSYIGAVFPLAERQGQNTSIFIPVKNTINQAVMKTGLVDSNAGSIMPLTASKKNLSKIIQQLQNRPYGWGGAFFFNDCSQEMKSIFAPFGIWLPRNSGAQAKFGSALDLSNSSVDERIRMLKSQGHAFMTIIYIRGHVMLYIGQKQDDHQDSVPITYQNVWGFRNTDEDRRYVIGQSVFLPLLTYFPEHPDIQSQANHSDFKLIYLDTLESTIESPSMFVKRFYVE